MAMVNRRAEILVLVVDDSLVNRTLLAHWIKEYGATALMAGSVAEASTLLAQYQPQLMIVDQQLPDGEGSSLYTRFHAAQPGPWLACTTLDRPEQRQALLDAGYAGVLEKPLARASLDRWLAGCSSHVTPPAPLNEQRNPSWGRIIDFPTALARLGGDQFLMQELASSFLDEWATLPSQLAEAHSSGDTVSLGRLAHTAGGLSGQFGLVTLQERLRLLENLCNDKELYAIGAEPLLEAVRSAFELAIPALQSSLAAPERNNC